MYTCVHWCTKCDNMKNEINYDNVGSIYFIKDGKYIKIGMTRDNVSNRIMKL
jgi:hypothetical protein